MLYHDLVSAIRFDQSLLVNLKKHQITYYGQVVSVDMKSLPFQTEEEFFLICEEVWYQHYCSSHKGLFNTKKRIDQLPEDVMLPFTGEQYEMQLKLLFVLAYQAKIVKWKGGFFWRSKTYPKFIIYKHWIV